MAHFKCPTCAGEYDDPQPDGMQYFHVCPPLERLLIRRLDGRTELSDSQVIVETIDDPIAGAKTRVRFDPPLPVGAVFLRPVSVKRPAHRDENVPGSAESDHEKMKEGKAERVEIAATDIDALPDGVL